MSALEIVAIPDLPEIRHGDRLGELLARRAEQAGLGIEDETVLVVSHKVVSKAEGRIRDLGAVRPGERARELAATLDKDPRLVELILAETRRIVRAERGVLIAETHAGWVCANAGVDASNVPGADAVTLLPEDADASARRLRAELERASGARPGVVVADSFGRPWRLGQAEVAIGCAGVLALDDRRGEADREGRVLTATAVAVADQLAAAADLVREKSSGHPAALVRGAGRWVTSDDGPGAAAVRRAASEDLFR